MALLRVSLVELLCQAATEWIPTLEYMLSGTRGLLQLHPVMLGG
jgi:hypothetical protein